MAIGEQAQRNHGALFPGHVSTLKVTDPELIEIFDNWAFGEVLEHDVLDVRTRLMNPSTLLDGGLETQRRIFGERIDQMIAPSPEDQLHIQRYLVANCFGDYYTRTGLDLETRELLTFSMIASMGGCEPQLAEHVIANLAAGNDRRVLVGVIAQLLPFIGYPRTLNALRVINEGTSK